MPLISVVIPVYNGEKTIRDTIESVLNQTFLDLELIVINDGSQDSTLDIVASIQDPRLEVFSYPNAGLSASRNRGIDHASGEFISFLDADDLWTPDKLEAQLKALQANPQAAVAYSWTNSIDESGKYLRRGCHITATGDVYKQLLVCNFLENGSNPLICRQALTAVGKFDESVNAAADRDMYLRLASRYHFVAVPSPQILYRVSTNSMSSNVLAQEKASLQVIERAFKQAPESLQYLKKSCLADIYTYLTFKALAVPSGRERGLAAARYFWYAVRNDSSVLRRRQTMLRVLFKIAILVLLPSRQSQVVLTKAKSLFGKPNKLVKSH